MLVNSPCFPFQLSCPIAAVRQSTHTVDCPCFASHASFLIHSLVSVVRQKIGIAIKCGYLKSYSGKYSCRILFSGPLIRITNGDPTWKFFKFVIIRLFILIKKDRHFFYFSRSCSTSRSFCRRIQAWASWTTSRGGYLVTSDSVTTSSITWSWSPSLFEKFRAIRSSCLLVPTLSV